MKRIRKKRRRNQSGKKIVYILGAGFSLGSNHFIKHAGARIDMPLQRTFFKVLNDFKNKHTNSLDDIAKQIRLYFNPKNYKTTRAPGRDRHKDLDILSIEEVVTFFDQLQKTSDQKKDKIQRVNQKLHYYAAELMSHLSRYNNPGKNVLIKRFVQRHVRQTDTIITFNWDTLLDRVLSNRSKETNWNRAYGYGSNMGQHLTFSKEWRGRIPHHPKLLKLHGSVNWVTMPNTEKCKILNDWAAGGSSLEKVVMLAPKLIKSTELEDGIYKKLWNDAERRLLRSKHIVFIGYSFPPADYAVSNLLRRVFSKIKAAKKALPTIAIVDPEAVERARTFTQLFGIEAHARNLHLSLDSFVDSNRQVKPSR